MQMPPRFSAKWLRVFAFYVVAVYALVSLPQIIDGSEIILRPLLGLAMLSVAVALTACLAGYIGGRAFFWVFSGFTFIGANYMIFLAWINGSMGWGDLRSYRGFLSFVAIGVSAGLLAQGVHSLYRVGERIDEKHGADKPK